MRYLLLITLIGTISCSDEGSEYKYSAKYNEGIVDYKDFEKDDLYESNKYSNDKNWGKDDRYKDPDVVGLEKDDKEDIVRPCSLEDWQCIRKFFSKNSKCTQMYGPVPDPLYFERNTVYLPFADITAVLTKLRVKGVASAKISEFYVNRNTGNLVFAINFSNLNLTSPNVYFRYKRRAKESIVLNDFTTAEIKSGTFTAVIPKVPHLRLDLAEIHADINDPITPFAIGPKAANQDPEVLAAFARLLSDIPTANEEAFLFLSQLLTGIYIQKNICDFGLKFESI